MFYIIPVGGRGGVIRLSNEYENDRPIQDLIFSGLIFTTAQVVFITTEIVFIFSSLSAVQIHDFHIFTVVYLNIVENTIEFFWQQ